jgi:hypothetical protein
MRLKAAFRWMNPNFFHAAAWYSWMPPHSYQLPGFYYAELGSEPRNQTRNHRDVFRRKYAGFEDDRFIDPLDGRVARLVVQAKQNIYDQPNDTTWRRTYIENVSPYIIRLAYWPMAYLTDGDKVNDHRPQDYNNRRDRMAGWAGSNQGNAAIRWLPACIGVFIMVCLSAND